MLIWLPSGYYEEHHLWQGVLLGAALITLVGALDDRYDLPPAVKLAGQVLAAVIVVHYGVAVKAITLPFVGRLAFPNAGVTNAGPVLTVIGLVAMMNVVNFSDGVDGLAAGVCAIIAAAMAVIAFDLGRQQPGVLAALTAGAALGFLIYNFPPASSFMGDCGANLLGLLMGVITVEAAVKTTAVVSFVLPLILLAVPFLDTTFVVLKRLKYKQPIYRLRQRALPPSHGPHRLLQQAHDRLPVRVDADARGTGAGVAVRPLLRPPRPPAHRLDARDDRDRAGRRRGQRVSRVRARDLQVQAPGLDPPAPAAPGRLARGDRARRGQDFETGEFQTVSTAHGAPPRRRPRPPRPAPPRRAALSARARRRARGGERRGRRAR